MNRALVMEDGPRPAAAPGWLTRGRVFALVAGYFLLQALLRVVASDSAELDESEQLIFTQTWAWGYGSEPPLYPWLQLLVFQIFGPSVLGLALLKNLLLFSAFVFTYLGAKEVSRDDRTALLAMLSLFLFPQITWESQRDLTHSVLATALGAATFWAAARTWKSGRIRDYVLLGVCVGLGSLSKYTYWLLALALTTSALTIPALRRAVLNRRMMVTVGVFALVTACHFHWLVFSHDLVVKRSKEVIGNSAAGFVHTRALAVLSLIKCVVMLGGVLSLVHLWCFVRAEPGKRPLKEELVQQWIWRTLLVTGLISLGVILGVGLELRDRWFQPIVFLGAISAALWSGARLSSDSERRFGRVIGIVAVVVLIVMPGIPLAASVTHRPTRLNAPYSVLGAELKGSIPEPRVIVAASRLVGGNLRFTFLHSTVVCPEFNRLPLPSAGPWLVTWDATKSAAAPSTLLDLVRQLRPGGLQPEPSYIQAPFKYTDAKRMKLGYYLLP